MKNPRLGRGIFIDRTNLFSGFSGGRLETNGHDAGGIGAGGAERHDGRPSPSVRLPSVTEGDAVLLVHAFDPGQGFHRTPLPRMRAPPAGRLSR